MNGFQTIAVTALVVCLATELVRNVGRRTSRAETLVRCLAWIAAALAILFPGAVQVGADGLGVGRGSDLVFYTFVLAFLCSTFYFYSRQKSMQAQITELIRRHAIEHARRGWSDPAAPGGDVRPNGVPKEQLG